jgi:hypothetical protein
MLYAVARRAGYALVERSIRHTFRQVVWVGEFTPPPADRPVVLYANHHVFQDSFVLGWLLERVLGRRTFVWMAEYHRFPFFGLLGAVPMAADDPRARSREVRRTAQRMATDPRVALIYYPEAVLHPAEEGIAPFPPERCTRLDRVLPPRWWWPVALRVTGHEAAVPTLLLTGGAPHEAATGQEASTLAGLLAVLAVPGDRPRRILLEGRRGPDQRWDFSRVGGIFPGAR